MDVIVYRFGCAESYKQVKLLETGAKPLLSM